MRAQRSLYICILFALLGACVELRAEPVPPKNVVYKPTFKTEGHDFTAGTAFLCQYPGKNTAVLMTAQHLLGPAGGFPSNVPWDALNQTIKKTTGVSMDDPSVIINCKQAILLEGAHALDKTGMENDIAVFESDATIPTALKLAEISPAVGDRVWLYGRERGGNTLKLFPGTVLKSNRKELDFVFDQNDIRLPGTSGAPVLNASGEVVAINIGGNNRSEKLVGYGNPVSSIRNHLQKALKP